MRIVLERGSVDAAGARYRVTVYEPGGVSHEASAHLAGEVELGGWSTEPPGWTRVFVARLLETLASKHGDGTWPRKITRWREGK